MPFPEALQRARTDLEAWTKVRGDPQVKIWVRWAGERLTQMMKTPRATIQFLDDPEPRLRLAAVALLAEYWRPGEVFAAPAIRSAFEDPEPAVRGGALLPLRFLDQYIEDASGRLGQLLHSVFRVFPPLPEAERQRISNELNEFHSHAEKIARVDERREKELAGASFSQMSASRESCESFFSHPDPALRHAAIVMRCNRWPHTKELGRVCEKLFFDEPDPRVRSMALTALALCYFRTDDERVGDLVARAVYDERQPAKLRSNAYHLLSSVRPVPREVFKRTISGTFRFPDDVDWSFVESFLRTSPEKGPRREGG